MNLSFTDGDGSVVGSSVAGLTAVAAFVGWWFHVRKLSRADKTGGDVTASISFVLNALKAEIARQAVELTELRCRLDVAEAQNRVQSDELEARRELESDRRAAMTKYECSTGASR